MKKDIETLFSVSTPTDGRHKLNTCPVDVPQSLLDKIENGCSLETIEELLRGYDIFKYQTQITIHGLFPKTSTKRIGSYVNLIQNKNLSIGVRYSAIDAYKKDKLQYLVVNSNTEWYSHMRSTTFSVHRLVSIHTEEHFHKVLKEMQDHIETIDKTLFFGAARIFKFELYGVVYLQEDILINAFYEKNLPALFENITGASYDEIYAKVQQKEKEREEYAIIVRLENEARKAAMQDFVENHLPEGVVEIEAYEPQKGDKVMCLKVEKDGDTYNVTPVYYEIYWKNGKIYKGRNESGKTRDFQYGKKRYVIRKSEPTKSIQSKPETAKSDVTIVSYSEKAIAVTGDTRNIKDTLKRLGGRFNPHLSCGAGWIFPRKKEADVRQALSF